MILYSDDLKKVHLFCLEYGKHQLFTAGLLPEVDEKGMLPEK